MCIGHKPLARQLRHQSTIGERMLWSRLKGKQFLDCKFLRQAKILNYIVDFLCRELKLVIEVDGRNHEHHFESDQMLQKTLEGAGYTILRFTELEVRSSVDSVMTAIANWIETHNNLTPPVSPPRGG